jgi:starch synthase
MSRILMVTSEAAPFAKTGGLADVLGALPPALAKLGEEVAVVLPRYGFLGPDASLMQGAKRIWLDMPIVLGARTFHASIDEIRTDEIRTAGEIQTAGVRYFFVDCPPLFDRPGVYSERGVDYADNHIRFAALNQAAIGIARSIFRPDIFHGHDWPAGLLNPYLRENFSGDPTFFGAKCVTTIHNLGYQGSFPATALADVGLDPKLFHSEGLEFWGRLNFLKAGLVWADAITTVSPTYAREIQTPEQGFGLDGVLRLRTSLIHGILNGVDYAEWNPEIDPHLPARYSSSDLAGKTATKVAVLRELGLPVNLRRPFIGIVSRFAEQKGFALLPHIAEELARLDISLVALGSGDGGTEEFFERLARAYPDKFAAHIGYDDGLAHRIEGAADMFLMPSRYEPCGLSQMYSLRYGTVPIVRATGGLDDTVDETTGFKFGEYTPEALLECIRGALTAWEDSNAWRARMRLGMAKNFSWDASAAGYQKLYRSL